MEEIESLPLTARNKRALQERLLAWFAVHARKLPWRGTRDLYRIWISEIMLQQTQVVTVIDYFNRFVARFPTLASLAAAEEQEVLALWEGLGYYRRARQLHAAARQVVAWHGGQFPDTAGAILSIGRDARLPILEANTVRLLSRLVAYRGATTSPAGQQLLWRTAEELLPTQEIGHFNQALMELGSLLCTPREPQCKACPVNKLCPTFKGGWQAVIPAPKPRVKYEAAHEIALVLRRRNGQVLLRCHPPDERWAGMWDFPRFPCDDPTHGNLAAHIAAHTGQHATQWHKLATLKHGVTRFRITLDVLLAEIDRVQTAKFPPKIEFRWLSSEALADVAMNVTARQIAQRLLKLGEKQAL